MYDIIGEDSPGSTLFDIIFIREHDHRDTYCRHAHIKYSIGGILTTFDQNKLFDVICQKMFSKTSLFRAINK